MKIKLYCMKFISGTSFVYYKIWMVTNHVKPEVTFDARCREDSGGEGHTLRQTQDVTLFAKHKSV